jgi:hypothetical protein
MNPKVRNTAIRFAAGMAFATMVAVFLAALAISAMLETGVTNVSYAQISQGQNPMCDPNDTHVNGIESRTCGIPKTPSLSSSSSSEANSDTATTMTNTGADAIAPATIPSENTTTQGIIPGLLP